MTVVSRSANRALQSSPSDRLPASLIVALLLAVTMAGACSAGSAPGTTSVSAIAGPSTRDSTCSHMMRQSPMATAERQSTKRRTHDGRYERVFAAAPGFDGLVETSALPFNAHPTRALQNAAEEFANAVRQTVVERGWGDAEVARSDGFHPSQPCSTHWVNLNYVSDGLLLDPARPEYVVFHRTHNGTLELTSVMFVTADDRHGPQPFGTLAVWHYHVASHGYVFCSDGSTAMIYLPSPECPPDRRRPRSSEMLHVSIRVGVQTFDPAM